MTHKVRIIKESDLETLEEIFNLRLRPDEGEDTSQTFIVRLMKESDVEEPMAEIHELEMIKTLDAAYTLDDISDGVQYARVALASLEDGKVLLSEAVGDLDDISNGVYGKVLLSTLQDGKVLISEALGDLDDIANGSLYGKVLLSDLSGGHILLGSVEGDLDDIADGTSYGKVLLTDISAGHIRLAACTGVIDDISDGAYGKVLVTDIQAGHVKLVSCTGTLDDISDGATYGKVLVTDISAGHILLAECTGTLDDIDDNTYGKILSTDISAGHIKLTSCVGTLDDIANGTSYGRVLLTDISAGHIKLSTCSGTLDDIANGTYGKVLVTDIEAGHIKLATCSGTIDDIVDGDYGKVLVTDISSGHILLASCVGDLDDISNGTTYGKVLATDLSAGHIVLSECIGDLDDIADGTTYGKIQVSVLDSGYLYLMRRSADATERLLVTASGIEGYANNVKNFELASGIAYLGDQANEHIKLSSSGLEIKDGATLLATYGSTVTIGEVGVSKSNVHITSGAIQLRNNETAKITLASDGSIALAGGITMGTTGYLRTTDKDNYADTTAGIFLGYDTDAYKLNIGDATKSLKWSGSDLILTGKLISSSNLVDYVAGNAVIASALVEVGRITTSYVKVKEIYVARAGTIRVKFSIKTGTTGNVVKGQVYRNGGAVGTERATSSVTFTEYSEDIAGWSSGDLVQLYIKVQSAVGETVTAKSFKVCVGNPISEGTNLD